MTISGSPKIEFYKKFRLIYFLVRALSDKNKWVRYHSVRALKEIGSLRALKGLQLSLEENKPGWWIENVPQTMQELAPHYPGGEEILDAIQLFNRDWDRKLRLETEQAISLIKSKKQKA